jgi:Tat protein secretion system quality control protein TatD with DNase activity
MSSSEKSRRQTIQAICQVPTNRLLAESDVHSSRHVAAGTAGAVAYIAWALQSNATTGGSNNDNNNNNNNNNNKSIQVMSIETVAQWTTQNAMRFLNGGAQYS